MSSENRHYYQDILKKSLLLSAAYIACLLLYQLCQERLQTELRARKFPAPPEWDWYWKYQFSKAAADQIPNENGKVVSWQRIATAYLALISILEDPAQGGKDVRPVLGTEKAESYVEGISAGGMDLSDQSEPWIRGYHSCLMGAAKALEHVDGWVVDTTRNTVFPPEVVIGPSNPNPKPVPFGAKDAPLEENCKLAFSAPEPLYIKILTSHGFTSGQRLEAAVAYADWLDFKGLSSTAEEMYDWALDIAMGALPVGVNNVVDMKTGIINSKATYISSNILIATTALAQHHARNNNPTAALPIFLSIVRARRHLLLPDPPKQEPVQESLSSYILSTAKSWFFEAPYPPPPPTGDEVPSRTPAAICEEAAIMSHIGEVLFASSSVKGRKEPAYAPVRAEQTPTTPSSGQMKNFQSGLSWTRDAVDLAEETLTSTGVGEEDQEARYKCRQCLAAGMENWSIMVNQMLDNERAAKLIPAKKKTALSTSLLWGDPDERNDNQNRWEGEARTVDARSRRIQRLLLAEMDIEAPLWLRILGKVKEV